MVQNVGTNKEDQKAEEWGGGERGEEVGVGVGAKKCQF